MPVRITKNLVLLSALSLFYDILLLNHLELWKMFSAHAYLHTCALEDVHTYQCQKSRHFGAETKPMQLSPCKIFLLLIINLLSIIM